MSIDPENRRMRRWLRKADRLDRYAAACGAVQDWQGFFLYGERADGLRRAVAILTGDKGAK